MRSAGGKRRGVRVRVAWLSRSGRGAHIARAGASKALAGPVGSLEGPVLAPIEMQVSGTKSSFRIPGVLELTQTPIGDAVSGQEREVQIVYPNGGFFWDVGNIATSATMSCDYGTIRFRHPGGFASYSAPTWTNQS